MQNALILAGGKSSRMGQDKSLLKFGDAPSMTHFLFNRLKPHFKDIKVAAKTPKFTPPLPLLIDEFKEFAPIYVIANLDKYYTSPVFIIAADTPLINIDTIKELYRLNSDIALASDGEFLHYLCGFYSPKVSQIAKKMIENSDLKLSNLAKNCDFKALKFDDYRQFFNINTKDEYQKASLA